MLQVIIENREIINQLCCKYKVRELYVFGSALNDNFDQSNSDIDFLVDFGSMDGLTKAHIYFDMLEDFTKLFDTRVDLVMVGAVKNRYIADDIEATKQILYAA